MPSKAPKTSKAKGSKAPKPSKAPATPVRKSTRVPNLDQPPVDLSAFKSSKAAKGLVKHLALAELSGLFLPPGASDLHLQRLV